MDPDLSPLEIPDPDDPVAARLFAAALEVHQHSYSPYSKYKVGAAILTDSGNVYSACNVENAAYPVSTCAEAGAISSMISAGEARIVAVLTVCDGETLGTCCGGCRQRIREFASLDTPVYAADPERVRAVFTVGSLLPHSFGPEHLHLDGAGST